MADLKQMMHSLVVACYNAALMKEEGVASVEGVPRAEAADVEAEIAPRKRRTSPTSSPKKASTETANSYSDLNCPLCKASLRENSQAIYCSRWNQDPVCHFSIRKVIAGKTLTFLQTKRLIETGKSGVLKGFRSKLGKPFAAQLLLKDGTIEFSFENSNKAKK